MVQNSTLVRGSISAKTYFENGTQSFNSMTATQVGHVASSTGASSSSDTHVASGIGTPFSMKMLVTLIHAGAGVSTFDVTATATRVPEPSAPLCPGIALFGIGGYAGRQRRKTTI